MSSSLTSPSPPNPTLDTVPLPLKQSHVVSSFSDPSVTLELPPSNLQFFLIKGSPFITTEVTRRTSVSISTVHDIVSFSSSDSLTKHIVRLDNHKTWLIYASSPIHFRRTSQSEISSDDGFSGFFRIAALPDSKNPKFEETLDPFSSCYPVPSYAALKKPYHVEYKFQKKRSGDLLMLIHHFISSFFLKQRAIVPFFTISSTEVSTATSSELSELHGF